MISPTISSPLGVSPEFRHIAVLDAIRGVAALAVFIHHYSQQFLDGSNVGAIGCVFSYLGVWGVGVFFVLSGFCIHWSTLTSKGGIRSFNFRTYIIRRFFRIYPALILCLLVCAILGFYWQTNNISRPSWGAFWRHAALLSTFSAGSRVAINSVVWSVVIECHFYLFYALFVPLLRRRGMVALLLLALMLGFSAYMISVLTFPRGEMRVLWQQTSMALWWQWCLGALLAEFAVRQTSSLCGMSALCLALSLVAFAFSLGIAFMPETLRIQAQRFALPPLAAIAIGGLILPSSRGWRVPLLSWLGEISYSIYLFHPAAILIVYYTIGRSSEIREFLAAFAIMVAIAATMYYIVEKNFVQIGKSIVRKLESPSS
ncbi:MAG: acyltransferase [Opitutaceae bacterium]|nr:acyltransferase [Opitutaceae bacterium]